MKKFILTIVLAMLCLFFRANAQGKNNNIKPLNIGDTIPEAIWNMPLQVVNHPEGKNSITLNEYRGKLIILDFWATWCSACIANFPKMEALQNEFDGKVQVLAVTYEDMKKINSFFSSKAGSSYRIASVVNDTILKKAFPHRGIPHCVWIDMYGKVYGITTAEEVNNANLTRALAGKSNLFQVKQDLDMNRPLFLSDGYPSSNDLLHYSILSKGFYSGLPSGNKVRKSGNIIIGRAVTNSDLLSIYEVAMWPLFNDKDDSYTRKKLVLEIADSALVMPFLNTSPDKDQLYTYDVVVPVKEATSLYSVMLEDLNHYSPFYGSIEKRQMKCWVLIKTGSLDLIKSKEGASVNSLYNERPARLINFPISSLVSVLNDMKGFTIPVIDETGLNDNVDLTLSGNFNPLQVKSDLHAFGLDLIEDYRNINVFVLKEKGKPYTLHDN